MIYFPIVMLCLMLAALPFCSRVLEDWQKICMAILLPVLFFALMHLANFLIN
jgi:hypothetical protein